MAAKAPIKSASADLRWDPAPVMDSLPQVRAAARRLDHPPAVATTMKYVERPPERLCATSTRARGGLCRVEFTHPPRAMGNDRCWRNLRVQPQTAFWRIALVRLAPRSEGVRSKDASIEQTEGRCRNVRRSSLFLCQLRWSTTLRLFAGISVIVGAENPTDCAIAATASRSRRPQVGSRSRRPRSNARLLGVVANPSRLYGP